MISLNLSLTTILRVRETLMNNYSKVSHHNSTNTWKTSTSKYKLLVKIKYNLMLLNNHKINPDKKPQVMIEM